MKKEVTLYTDYSNPLQRKGLMAIENGVSRRPTLSEIFTFYLSRVARGFPLSEEEKKIRKEYGNN